MAVCLNLDRNGSGYISSPINTEPNCNEREKAVEITIKENLKMYGSNVNQTSTINKVPHYLRDVHDNAFDPKLVSIGPIHWKKPHLSSMEEHKWRFLYRRLDSTTTREGRNFVDNEASSFESSTSISSTKCNNNGVDKMISKLSTEMTNMEIETRKCYSDKFDHISSKEFVLMMMLDGCFVVELLCLFYDKCFKDSNKPKDGNENKATYPNEETEVDYVDSIFKTRWMVPNLRCDLFLLENQIPFNVLENILELTKSDKETQTTSLENLAVKFFEHLMPKQWNEDKQLDKTTPHHFLDLCRSRFISKSIKEKKLPQTKRISHTGLHLIHCATELREAGIKFKKREQHDLLDIEFKNGILEIPHLLFDDQTGNVFLNFVAYEQCNESKDPYFTAYLLFLDNLVNSEKDVELLHYKGIIDHVLGSDNEVAELLNKLSKESIHDDNNWYLSTELNDIHNYYNKKGNKWRAQLKHNYFSNPWAYFSFGAAVFLLLLTVVQTFFSIYSYVRPT